MTKIFSLKNIRDSSQIINDDIILVIYSMLGNKLTDEKDNTSCMCDVRRVNNNSAQSPECAEAKVNKGLCQEMDRALLDMMDRSRLSYVPQLVF